MARKALIPEHKPYNRSEIFKELESVHCILNEAENETYHHGKLIRNFYVGDKFKNFDFVSFFKDITSGLEKIYSIDVYTLKIYSGIQELKLMHSPFIIDGDRYYQCLTILNSTDTTKTLQIVPCLYKIDGCVTMVMSIDTIMEQARHYSLSIETKTSEVVDKLHKLHIMYDRQMEILKSMKSKKLKMSSVANSYKDKPTDNYKFNSFRYRLKISEHNSIEIDDNFQKLLDASINFIAEKKYDYILEYYKSFVCYAEVFRNRDIHEIKRECLTFIKKIK
jgi:hypothetical protein